MAVSLTAHGSNTPAGAASSITQSATVSTSGSTLLVGVSCFDGSNGLNTHATVTYNGVSMTQVDGLVAGSGAGASNYSFILQNVASGTANVVVTFAGTCSNPAMLYAVFSGAATSGGADAHNVVQSTATSNATPGSLSVTTVANNAVVWGWGGFDNNSGAAVAGSNQTQLDTAGGGFTVDGYLTTAKTPAGSVTLSYNNGTTDTVSIFLVSMAPSGGGGGTTAHNLTLLGVGK